MILKQHEVDNDEGEERDLLVTGIVFVCDFWDGDYFLTCAFPHIFLWWSFPSIKYFEQRPNESFIHNNLIKVQLGIANLCLCFFDNKRRTQTMFGVKVLSKATAELSSKGVFSCQ
jgi:hypothetical protein